MDRNKLGLAAAALACGLAAALLAGRLKGVPAAPPPGPELAPLSSTIVTPLSDGTRYTNEELARRLQEETGRMGITGIAKPEETGSDEDSSFLGQRLGQPGTRAQAETYIRELARMRRPFEKDKDKTVKLPGGTAGLLGAPPKGRPLDEPPPQN